MIKGSSWDDSHLNRVWTICAIFMFMSWCFHSITLCLHPFVRKWTISNPNIWQMILASQCWISQQWSISVQLPGPVAVDVGSKKWSVYVVRVTLYQRYTLHSYNENCYPHPHITHFENGWDWWESLLALVAFLWRTYIFYALEVSYVLA